MFASREIYGSEERSRKVASAVAVEKLKKNSD